MFFITSLGLGAKKFNDEFEARENMRNKDELHVAMTYQEYADLINNHSVQIKEMQAKIDSAKAKENKLKCEYNDSIKEKNENLQQLQRRVENYKSAVGKWQRKAQGIDKSKKHKSLSQNLCVNSITGIKIPIDRLKNGERERIEYTFTLQTTLPENMDIESIIDYFKNSNVDDFLENGNFVGDPEDYILTEAYLKEDSNSWIINVVKLETVY